MELQPESEDHTALSDTADLKNELPVDAVLDLALDWNHDAFIVEIDQDETPLAMCQICMDFVGSKEVHRYVCGPCCLAEVCSSCLVQHLTATVYSFYVGVLPKMRCPVCLVLLNKAQWTKYVLPPPTVTSATFATNTEAGGGSQDPSSESDHEEDSQAEDGDDGAAVDNTATSNQQDNSWLLDNSHIVEKYEVLCRQSCGFQSPCCHNTDFSMLKKMREGSVNPFVTLTLPPAQAKLLPQLSIMYREYSCHRVEVADMYAFIQDTFGHSTEEVVEALVNNTLDDERRANLLLLHLFHNPDTYTHCCNRAVCFKCKSAVHHDGKCGDFVVDENVLDCPGCRVTLVKVDGCDSVTCLCGTSIEWPQEMAKQRIQRKQLAPSDNKVYRDWRRWSRALKRCLREINNLETTWRKVRLQRVLKTHRGVLQDLVDRAVRRARLNILIREHGERLRPLLRAHLERRKASISKESTEEEPVTEENQHCIAPAA